ncbi:hypothetical protein L915_02774, partial [Phytophthora nicotianae]
EVGDLELARNHKKQKKYHAPGPPRWCSRYDAERLYRDQGVASTKG